MIAALVIMRLKISKLKMTANSEMTSSEKENITTAFERENQGLILHDEKPKNVAIAGDIDLEYAFNTIARNSYKTVSLWNFESDYEKKSFEKIIKTKVVKSTEKYDFALVNTNGKVYESIKEIYANLNEKGMIFVVNAPKKSKEIKTLRYDLKALGYRNEWQELSKGIVLIAK